MPKAAVLICAWLLIVPVSVDAKFRDPLDTELPVLEVVPGAEWFWAGRRIALNNVPMSIKLFSFPGKAEAVEKYYTGLWKTKGHGKSSKKTIGDLIILAYQLDGILYSVQFSQKGQKVDGKIVVSPTPLNSSTNRKTLLPIPPRSDVTSKMESLDGGKRSETLNIDSRLLVPQIIDFYISELQRNQWALYGRSGDGQNGAVLSFQRGGELLQLTIKGLQGRNSKFSQVLIHWIK